MNIHCYIIVTVYSMLCWLGWWLGVKGGSTGWIPSTYLSRLEPGEEEVLEPSESNGESDVITIAISQH